MSDIIQIAVDGHSSCGKSTLARDIAARMNILYIDSGAMYRAVSLYLINHDISWQNEQAVKAALPAIHIGFSNTKGLMHTILNDDIVEMEIRNSDVAAIVSQVAAIESVRNYLVAQQQDIGSVQSVVMDGRDIGTVVFPSADVKFFVTASLEVRTMRRWKELREKNMEMSVQEVRKNLLMRDEIDSSRKHSPLIRAEDAILIDNSEMNRAQQLEYALHQIQDRTGIEI